MPSSQSRLFRFVLRHSHLLRLQFRRQVWDENTSIPGFRATCERTTKLLGRIPADVTVTPVSADGLRAEWLVPANAAGAGVVLYAIGGGYVSGSCDDHRHIVARIARESRTRVLIYDHRLAPEDPFPAALDDTVTAYRWLLSNGTPASRIVIAGESAGGGLCLAALLAFREQGLPLPAAAVALSPWTDLALTGESHRAKAKVCLSPKGMAEVCSRHYAGANDPTLPLISPLYGDLHGLPPLHITVGGDETMLDDATRFAKKAQAAGVGVTLRVGAGMMHCYPLLPPFVPEAREAMAEICAFIRRHVGG